MNYYEVCKKHNLDNLSGANLSGAYLFKANLKGANLEGANLKGADLFKANLSGANLSRAYLSRAYLSRANLQGANLEGANLFKVNLQGADLSGANLAGANLSGANLQGADLSGAKEIGNKKDEIAFAKKLLELLASPENKLEMVIWHTCTSAHCIAGWAFPNEEFPGQKASLLYPTLAKYFFATNADALSAIKRVALGEESIFN